MSFHDHMVSLGLGYAASLAAITLVALSFMRRSRHPGLFLLFGVLALLASFIFVLPGPAPAGRAIPYAQAYTTYRLIALALFLTFLLVRGGFLLFTRHHHSHENAA